MPRSSRFGRLGEGWGEDVERSEATRPRDARTVVGWLWVPAGTGTGTGTGTPWRVPECGYTAVGARGGPHLFDGGPWDLTACDGCKLRKNFVVGNRWSVPGATTPQANGLSLTLVHAKQAIFGKRRRARAA